MNPPLKKVLPWMVVVVVFLFVGGWLLRERHEPEPSPAAPVRAESPAKLPSSPPPRPAPAIAANGAQPIDLSEIYLTTAAAGTGFETYGPWLAIPRGQQIFGGVPFEYTDYIGLWGQNNMARGQIYRERVDGIPVRRKFASLYVLHTMEVNAPSTAVIAELLFHYVDGTSQTNVIRGGSHLAIWQQQRNETGFRGANTLVVWRGSHPELPRNVHSLRIFATEFSNPKPELEVSTIELVSTKTAASEILFALTTGPAGLLQADPNVAEPAVEPETEETTMVFTAQDAATSKPIPGMQVKVMSSQNPASYVFDTDEKGQVSIPVPPLKISTFAVAITAEDYPPYSILWPLQDGKRIPTNYVFKVDKGVTIGGIVRDEEGSSIEGATVAIHVKGPVPNLDGKVRRGLNSLIATTDQDGRWTYSRIPRDLAGEFGVHLSHRDYLLTAFRTDPTPRDDPGSRISAAELKASKAVLVMKRPPGIIGFITGPDGKPVDNAQVLLGEKTARLKRLEFTGAEGSFRFRNLPEGPTNLTIQAEGLAPELVNVDVRRGMEDLKIQLKKGNLLKARVLDRTGAPVADAQVIAETWRGRRTLEWQTITDDAGRFQWDSAPADPVTFAVTSPGFLPLREAVTADGMEHSLTLRRAASIAGKVTDADTGEPVVGLSLALGRDFGGGGNVIWDQNRSTAFAGRGRGGQTPGITVGEGSYRVETGQAMSVTFNDGNGTRSSQSYLVKISAPGYLPQISKPIRSEGDETTFDFRLKKGRGPNGVILGMDGRPLEGAQVTQNLKSRSMYLGDQIRTDFRRQPVGGVEVVLTDPQGHFELQPDPEATTLLVAHASGFVEVPVEKVSSDSPIQLQPWGRMEGQLKAGTNVVAGAKVQLTSTPNSGFGGGLNFGSAFAATTDAEGRFVFDPVPPGQRIVGRVVPVASNAWTYTHSTPVQVVPGKTTNFTMGGTGKPIVGQVKFSDPGVTVNWPYSRFALATSLPVPRPNLSPAEQIEWRNSPEYVLAIKNRRSYSVQIRPDGTFRLDDIPAGSYQLNITASAPVDPNTSAGRVVSMMEVRTLGTLIQDVTIPEMPGGRSDEPLDLGMLEIKAPGATRTVSPVAGRNLNP